MSDEKQTAEAKTPASDPPPQGPLREMVQPFIDLARAPRALWGINISYFLEGLAYFGIVGYLQIYFSGEAGLGDVWAGLMLMLFTGGITVSQLVFGGLSDRWGVRKALFVSIALMLVGRLVLAGAPTMKLAGGVGSPLHYASAVALLIVVLGYGMYMPCVYSATRQVTTEKTKDMAYAMLYAVMNLGGWLPTFFFAIRERIGMVGAFWVYTGITACTLLITVLILSRRTLARAVAAARAAAPEVATPAQPQQSAAEKNAAEQAKHQDGVERGTGGGFWRWLKKHPLANGKFAYFIFVLIPVQTLFAHNWLTLPPYVERAYAGTWIGAKFEIATNFNPLLIFILAPLVAALSRRAKVYNMMIAGTAVMAIPAFFLALGPNVYTLGAYLVAMTVGEAMWQPRFLQYAAEIAPEGRTGEYIGVAQIPWFMTKFITGTYSGFVLSRWCPKPPGLGIGPDATPAAVAGITAAVGGGAALGLESAVNATGGWASGGGGGAMLGSMALRTEWMWLLYGLIAISSTILLILAKGWLGKNFKTKAD